MRLRKLFTSGRYYSVCECDRTTRLVLHVLAGGVALYAVVVELSPEEELEFRTEGQLDALARDVARNTSCYGDRMLRPEGEGDRLEFVEEL